jgi:hypothetical protein
MSIATLKRKTQTKYNNMSVGEKNFSLNGTHRSQGFVGQTMLSRSLPRSLMKGNTLRGHGGCCGTYTVKPIVQSAVTSTEDSNIIKSSVISTNGLIDTKYRWINRPAPYSSVKPDSNVNLNTQGQHTESRAKRAVLIADANISLKNSQSVLSKTKAAMFNTYFRKSICNYSKPESTYLPITSAAYLINKNNICTSNDIINFQKPSNGNPLPGN